MPPRFIGDFFIAEFTTERFISKPFGYCLVLSSAFYVHLFVITFFRRFQVLNPTHRYKYQLDAVSDIPIRGTPILSGLGYPTNSTGLATSRDSKPMVQICPLFFM